MDALWQTVKAKAIEIAVEVGKHLPTSDPTQVVPSIAQPAETSILSEQEGTGAELTVYVLELADECYYVGITKDLARRWEEHLAGKGSGWTNRHKPLRIVESFPHAHKFDELKYTLIYMEQYGIEKVRGGPYVTLKISNEVHESIMVILDSADGRCSRCYRKGHYVAQCYAKIDADGNLI